MGNAYYQPGQARSDKVRDLFGAIALRYDLLNDLQSLGMHRRWKRLLIRLAQAQTGQRALDLCCGTGDIALRLAQSGLEVVGLDFSLPMLARATARRGKLGLSRVTFCQGDAQHLPFSEASFDVVTMAYGLRNLADWGRGLEEMWRVTRPGGRILILEFGRPVNVIWRAFYFAYLRGVVPILGKLFCGDAQAYAYILESLRHYPGAERVAERLRTLGAAEVLVRQLWGGTMSIHVARKA